MDEAKQIKEPETFQSKLPETPGTSDQAQAEEGDSNLAKLLLAAREKRALSRDEVVSQTRIPAHYLRMMESSDYAPIADQLYVVPFLRRYAVFLGLDPEETAMRFVHEVQRADNAPAARMYAPVVVARKRRRRFLPLMLVVVLFALVAWLFGIEFQRHQESGSMATAAPPVSDHTASRPAGGAGFTPSVSAPPAALPPAVADTVNVQSARP
ncbi:MAG: helix-turn-helix domain-containing protein [Candidatus Binataceae bacterium]